MSMIVSASLHSRRPIDPVIRPMHDFVPRSSVLRLRARLARRLALVSLGGLALLLGVTLSLVALALSCAGQAWAAIGEGEPLRTLSWVCAGLVSVALALGGAIVPSLCPSDDGTCTFGWMVVIGMVGYLVALLPACAIGGLGIWFWVAYVAGYSPLLLMVAAT